jgi:hypothetical protein
MRSRVFAAAVTLVGSFGDAQTLPEAPLEAPSEIGAPTHRVWYGWQTLIVAGTSTAAGLAVNETASYGFCGVALVVGGATVHWVHGHIARGFASIGLDLGLGLAGAGLGALIGESSNRAPDDGSHATYATFGALAGVSVGLGVALLIDVAALGYDDVSDATAPRSQAWMAPTMRLARGGGMLGVAGEF